MSLNHAISLITPIYLRYFVRRIMLEDILKYIETVIDTKH